jgi:hypothetical protein
MALSTHQARLQWPELIHTDEITRPPSRSTWANRILEHCDEVILFTGPPDYTTNGKLPLKVHRDAVEAFETLAALFYRWRYPFGETAGGTLSLRQIPNSGKSSLHAHGIALDINPRQNPYPSTRTTIPDELGDAIRNTRTKSGHEVFRWGLDYFSDPMHFEPTGTDRANIRSGIDPTSLPDGTLEDYYQWTGQQPGQEETMFVNQGDRGPVVEYWQRRLNRLGATLNPDGIYGPKTAEAVAAFTGSAGNAIGPTEAEILDAFDTSGGGGQYLTPGVYQIELRKQGG